MDKVGAWIAVGSALISVVTLLLAGLTFRFGAKQTELVHLEGQVTKMERDLNDCQRRCRELMEENLLYLRRLSRQREEE